MRRRGAKRNSSDLPPQLLRSAPRDVGLSIGGAAALIAVTAVAIAGCFGAIKLYGDVVVSERQVALFASEAVAVGAEVVRVQRRGGGDDVRSVIDYRYLAGDQELTGTATLRRQDPSWHPVGSRVDIRYLASDPDFSWIEGDGPRREPFWPVVLLPVVCMLAVAVVAWIINRQADLLANGRLAHATVTNVAKKQSDHGPTWRVTYQWRLLSGAIRSARFERATKQPPAVGTSLPVLYDRDQPSRQRIYPLSLVKLKTDG